MFSSPSLNLLQASSDLSRKSTTELMLDEVLFNLQSCDAGQTTKLCSSDFYEGPPLHTLGDDVPHECCEFEISLREHELSLANAGFEYDETQMLEGLLEHLNACDAQYDIQTADSQVAHDFESNPFSDEYIDEFFDYALASLLHRWDDDELSNHVLKCFERTRPDGTAFMFGNVFLESAYRILQLALQKDDVCCIYKVEESAAQVSVSLCNIWKFTRMHGQSYIEHAFRDPDIFSESGSPNIPSVRLVPAMPQRLLGSNLVNEGVKHYLRYYVGNSTNEARTLRLARRFPEFVLVERVLIKGTRDRLVKRLGIERFEALSETTSKIIWKLLIDKEFFSIVAYARQLSPVFLSHYIRAAHRKDILVKVSNEDKKMLVLYDILAPSEFMMSESFSTKRWVKTGVTTDNLFMPKRQHLSGPAAVRALRNLHPGMLRRWGLISMTQGFPILFEVLAKLANEPKIPQPVMWQIIKLLGSKARGATSMQHFASLAHIVRLYVRQVRSMTNGETKMSNKAAIALLDLGGVLDWWCVEGHPEFPNSQSTWNSVSLRAQDWHVRVCNPVSDLFLETASWRTLVAKTRVDEVTATCLTTNADLKTEGNEMFHCVGTYGRRCLRGDMQIFALSMDDGQRSTLSITRSAKSWVVSENRAKGNSAPAAKLASVGKKVAALYTKAEKAACASYLVAAH